MRIRDFFLDLLDESTLLILACLLASAIAIGLIGSTNGAEPQLRFEPPSKPAPPAVKPEAKKAIPAPKPVVPPPDASLSPPNSTELEYIPGSGKQPGYPDFPVLKDPFGKKNTPAAPLPKGDVHKGRVYIRFYTAKDCGVPCHSFLKWRETFGNTVGCEMEHFQFDSVSKAAERFPSGVPRFELYKPGGKMEVRTGWSTTGAHEPGQLCPDCLRAWVAQAKGVPEVRFNNQGELRVAAKRPITVPFKMPVQQAFAVLKQARVGQFSLRIHCNDGKREIRVAGKNKTPLDLLAVVGNSGRIEFDAPGSKLPNGKLNFAYRVYSNTRVGIDADEVVFDFGGAPKAAASGEKCGIEPFTILSALLAIANLMNSSASLVLPPDIHIAGTFADRIDAKFTRGNPEVDVHFGWDTASLATAFNVTADKLHLDLMGQDWAARWFHPRKYEIQFN